jgi:hypothetical protein
MTTTKSTQEAEWRTLYNSALEAGQAAGASFDCQPMIVGSPTTALGSDIDYTKETYFVPDGPCGFAWINICPGTSSFARWLVKNGVARKAYDGGVNINIRKFGQSMERKEACARAATEIFRAAGITAYAGSRLD